MIPEPALRPAASRGPGLERCHASRLFAQDGGLVLRTRGRTRRFPVGGTAGIARAVIVDAAAGGRTRGGPDLPGSWGEVQLQDGNGALIGRFDIQDWLPEAPALPGRSVQGEQLLARSGVAGLLRAAGVPLHVVRDRNDPLVASKGAGASLGPGGSFPLWYWGVRTVAGSVWFAVFTWVVFSDTTVPWVVLLLAATAFSAPVARLALRAWTRLRAGRHDPVVRERVRPSPARGTGETVRFRRDTEIRIQDRDLVLRDLGGQEYWFALSGPHAVTSLVRVEDRAGRPVGVELRGPGEQVRAVFPWDLWFGGEEGADGWSRLRRAAGLAVSERRLGGKGPGAWPKGPVLGTGLLPGSGGEARRMARFPGTVAGVSSTAVMAFGSLFSLIQGLRIEETAPGPAAAAVLMGVLGLVLQAVPYAVHQLRSRLLLDRPTPERTTSREATR
ncbi:hypothetical protein OH738_16850 [Streptomyces hirsutus]|uniref:Integral membrane protein n=1 Tax=Streptomyces hirsutus TaxID=35620 RepID=A0ABZ1GSF3_9ACTN|nr:hypothetical protein [Streptomyces hirsutus]WSD08237.1 hypothetical protein OIE73_22585 [Streptomyces hirsutus]WTD18308.1 hypothetical protein OH738_16850 [Streptomyces hirsutus]WTD76765.1 hypothetical protein OHB56_24620 [Streptomyces sp. NBC_01635]